MLTKVYTLAGYGMAISTWGMNVVLLPPTLTGAAALRLLLAAHDLPRPREEPRVVVVCRRDCGNLPQRAAVTGSAQHQTAPQQDGHVTHS